MLESGAETVTDATDGGATVRRKVAGPTPSTVTPFLVVPGLTAVMSPPPSTVATPVALLDQVTVLPLSERMLFAASRATTVACTVCPVVMLESVAETLTAATGTAATDSTNVAGPTPSTVTPIVVVPDAKVVISPALESFATPVAPLDQLDLTPA